MVYCFEKLTSSRVRFFKNATNRIVWLFVTLMVCSIIIAFGNSILIESSQSNTTPPIDFQYHAISNHDQVSNLIKQNQITRTRIISQPKQNQRRSVIIGDVPSQLDTQAQQDHLSKLFANKPTLFSYYNETLKTFNPKKDFHDFISNLPQQLIVNDQNLPQWLQFNFESVEKNQQLNNNTHFLIFHRIAKTGSESIWYLLRKIKGDNVAALDGQQQSFHNEWKYHFSQELWANQDVPQHGWKVHGSMLDRCVIKQQQQDMDFKYCFFRTHSHFLDNITFIESHLQPILSLKTNKNSLMYNNYNYASNFFRRKIEFMTVIREPMSRIESIYYYLRGKGGGYRKNGLNVSEVRGVVFTTLNFTFEQCILDLMQIDYNYNYLSAVNDVDDGDDIAASVININHGMNGFIIGKDICRLPMNYMTRFFCGQDEIVCKWNSLNIASLYRALENMNKYFGFVGLMEEFELSLRMLYFRFKDSFIKKGISLQRMFEHLNDAKKKENYGKMQHPKFNQNTIVFNFLARKNELDLLLYDYVKQYFNQYVVNT